MDLRREYQAFSCCTLARNLVQAIAPPPVDFAYIYIYIHMYVIPYYIKLLSIIIMIIINMIYIYI